MLDLTVDALWTAWERVRENEGCAGVDGVTVESYDHQTASGLPELLQQAEQGIYRPLPLRLIVVEKKPGSAARRNLAVPAVRDRVLQTAVARALSRSFEEEFLEACFAYRANRGVDRAVARILQLRDRGWAFVVDADIASYFDSVSHSHLLNMLKAQAEIDASVWELLRLWIKTEIWDGHEVKECRRGIAQGSPISPLLSNYYLGPLDRTLAETDDRLIRYADDFVILCRSREASEKALDRCRGLLAGAGLELNAGKTRLTSFEEGFQFLGVQFHGKEAAVPWKAHSVHGRVVYMAHVMPGRLLKKYRHVEPLPHGSAPALHKSAPQSNMEAAPSSEMAFLYITQQGAVLRKSGDRFLVEQDGQIALDLPYHRLDHILVFGNVQLMRRVRPPHRDAGHQSCAGTAGILCLLTYFHWFLVNGRFDPEGGKVLRYREWQWASFTCRVFGPPFPLLSRMISSFPLGSFKTAFYVLDREGPIMRREGGIAPARRGLLPFPLI